jgi:hypothetical protein
MHCTSEILVLKKLWRPKYSIARFIPASLDTSNINMQLLADIFYSIGSTIHEPARFIQTPQRVKSQNFCNAGISPAGKSITFSRVRRTLWLIVITIMRERQRKRDFAPVDDRASKYTLPRTHTPAEKESEGVGEGGWKYAKRKHVEIYIHLYI